MESKALKKSIYGRLYGCRLLYSETDRVGAFQQIGQSRATVLKPMLLSQ